MLLTRGLLGVAVFVACSAVMGASAAAPVGKAPRIVAAAMQDSDRDARADSVRLTYSARVRHARDRDGRYPFAVAGYRIRVVGAASGKVLMLVLVERAQPDSAVRPAIRYRRTRLQPVTLRSGLQAAPQLFRGARAHGKTPPVVTAPPPPTPPTAPPSPADADGDGTVDGQDCAPRDGAIHPKAPDLPDLAFVDSNCDGIDGTEKDAIFASPRGKDADPGTKAKPKREIRAAVAAAAGNDRYVVAAAGSYAHVTAVTGIDLYGGYDPDTWARKASLVTAIAGSPEAVLADGARDVTLQLLSVRGSSNGASAYGIRAIANSDLRLQRVTVIAGGGGAGLLGRTGRQGRPGGPGLQGDKGACDSFVRAIGGAGGDSPVGRDGGRGGNAYYQIKGQDGAPGVVGTPGGKGGSGGQPASGGRTGANGANGVPGTRGAGGNSSTAFATTTWRGVDGGEGVYGGPGNGGGGGGGGGGQTGAFVVDGSGNAGSGGGGGAEGGRGGEGGSAGGGSFGVYLHNSTIRVEAGSIAAGDGGAGARGGAGGAGGTGGPGYPGRAYCVDEVGRGGASGRGGDGGEGGGGGGGAGGPSIGVMKVGASSAILSATAVTVGAGGPGGAHGAGGTGVSEPGDTGLRQAVHP